MRKIILFCSLILFTKEVTAQNYNVSNTEALQTAQTIETSVKKGNPEFLSNFFDLTTLDSLIQEKSIAAKQSREMFEGFKSSFNMNFFGKQMIDNLQDGSYQLVRSYHAGNQQHLLFRAFGKSGVNYHDYALIKVNNIIKAADVHIYLSGEDISTTLADLIDASIPPSSDMTEIPENLQMLLRLKDYKKTNNYKGFIKFYDSLNDDFKKNKAVQIIYIIACKKVDLLSDRYKMALENYAAIFPDDASTPLFMIDFYFLTKDYDKALSAINKLDSFVNDPFLNFFRANVYLVQGDKKQAMIYYDSVFEKYRTASYTIKNLVMLHMNAGEKSIAKTDLEIYKKTDGFKQQYVDELYSTYPELKD
jgi:tetratricopeptide (TPR) repeat protein